MSLSETPRKQIMPLVSHGRDLLLFCKYYECILRPRHLIRLKGRMICSDGAFKFLRNWFKSSSWEASVMAKLISIQESYLSDFNEMVSLLNECPKDGTWRYSQDPRSVAKEKMVFGSSVHLSSSSQMSKEEFGWLTITEWKTLASSCFVPKLKCPSVCMFLSLSVPLTSQPPTPSPSRYTCKGILCGVMLFIYRSVPYSGLPALLSSYCGLWWVSQEISCLFRWGWGHRYTQVTRSVLSFSVSGLGLTVFLDITTLIGQIGCLL